MTAARDLQRDLNALAQATELERERLDVEIAELRDRVRALEGYVGNLQDVTLQLAQADRRLHSVRVEP